MNQEHIKVLSTCTFSSLCDFAKLAPVLPNASMNENGKTAGGMSAFKDGRSDLIPF